MALTKLILNRFTTKRKQHISTLTIMKPVPLLQTVFVASLAVTLAERTRAASPLHKATDEAPVCPCGEDAAGNPFGSFRGSGGEEGFSFTAEIDYFSSDGVVTAYTFDDGSSCGHSEPIPVEQIETGLLSWTEVLTTGLENCFTPGGVTMNQIGGVTWSYRWENPEFGVDTGILNFSCLTECPAPPSSSPTQAPTPSPAAGAGMRIMNSFINDIFERIANETETEAPISSPTTSAPTGSTTTEAPISSPTTDTTDANGSGCFSDRNKVQVKDKGLVAMKSLSIGDEVMTSRGYSKVYSFLHYEPSRSSKFLQIQCSQSTTPLEITMDHMLYVLQKDKKMILLPASDIKVGDSLAAEQGRIVPVKSIRNVQRRGLYAPLTATGDIVVSGLVASNYVTLPPAFQTHTSFDQQHWIQHAVFVPYRAYCGFMGCKNETYDKLNGLPKAAGMWLPVLEALERHSIIVFVFVHLVFIPAQWAILNLWTLLAAVLGYFVWSKTNNQKAIDIVDDDKEPVINAKDLSAVPH